jgi:hypothetical protein
MSNHLVVLLTTFSPLKLVEIVIVMVLGSVEDKRTFSIVNFMKSKFYNHLTTHLDLAIKMHLQKLYEFTSYFFLLFCYFGVREGQDSLWKLING